MRILPRWMVSRSPFHLCGQLFVVWLVFAVGLHLASFYDLLTWGTVADLTMMTLLVVVVVTMDIVLLALIGPLFKRHRN